MSFRYPLSGSYTLDSLADAETNFNFTDPVGTGLQTNNTARRWCWHNADTTSSNVGPTSGAGGSPDGYVYTEASSPGAAADEFYMEFDQTLDASANNIEVQFKTNQRGNDNDATCVVETNENGAGWVERGSTFGGSSDPDKVATSGTQIWSSRSVDLTGLISHASTRIRLKVILAGATIWNCDYGIDELVFIGVAAVSREQDSFRFENDDGSESGSTFKEAQNTDITIDKETNFRPRVGGQMTGDAPTEAATLQYKETSDAATEWKDM